MEQGTAKYVDLTEDTYPLGLIAFSPQVDPTFPSYDTKQMSTATPKQ